MHLHDLLCALKRGPTLQIGRLAELGFLGGTVYTRTHTPFF